MIPELYLRLIMIIIAIIISYTLTEIIVLKEKKDLIINKLFVENLTISPETKKDIIRIPINPGYFTSIGKVYILIYSPYSESYKEFKVNLSSDGNNWKEVPFYSSLPNEKDYSKYADLGYVELKKPYIDLYREVIIPPKENITLPSGVTKEEFLNSFEFKMNLKRETTTQDNILLLITRIALFGVIFAVLNSFSPLLINVSSF
jgi:hypothetical protein